MFKSNQDEPEDFKKKRDEFTQNVRKTNREEKFKKMRNILTPATQQNSNQNKKEKLLIVDSRYADQIEKFLTSTYTLENFNELLQSISSEDILRQHYGLIGIRKILSIAENPPIQPVIDAGLVPKMIDYVKQMQYPQLQLEATWALTNVASGTTIQCQSIIDKGGIPLFIDLLKSSNVGIVEQAIWAIGNIASDCVFYRDNIIRNGGVINTVEAVKNHYQQTNIVKHGAWALSNLCRGNPLPKYQNVRQAIPLLCELIAHRKINDKEIQADCCWAISYHSDSKKNKIDVLMQANVIPVIVNNITDAYLSLVVPSIRILGNVSTGTTIQTDQILKYDGLNKLVETLNHHKKVVRRQSCWVVSNICAGSIKQIEAVFSNSELIRKLIELFETDSNDVRRQICYIFSNISHNGSPEVVYKIYKEYEIVRFYVNLLMTDDSKTIEVALETLYIVLSVGGKIKGSEKNPLVQELYNLNAIDHLEKLQYHDSDVVYGHVSKLLQNYFEVQDPLEL